MMCCYHGAASKLGQFIVMAFRGLKQEIRGIEESGGTKM